MAVKSDLSLSWSYGRLKAFMRTEFLCISVLRVASGPSAKLAGHKSALTSPVVYSTDRSKAVVPVLIIHLLCGLFYEAICLKSCFVLFYSCFFFFFFFSFCFVFGFFFFLFYESFYHYDYLAWDRES